MSQTATETVTEANPSYVVPKQCKAGVVVNEGPDFRVVNDSWAVSLSSFEYG